MPSYFQWLISFTFIISCCSKADSQDHNTLADEQSSAPIIILKMDDLEYTDHAFVKNWEQYVDSIQSYQLNSGLGIIINGLIQAPQSFKDSLISWHEGGVFEIWHHGWDHKRMNFAPDNSNEGEFMGTPCIYQRDHLDRGQEVVKSELGITMRTFGAPYNKTDSVFSKVIEEHQQIKVWLYCEDFEYPELCLTRGKSNKLESSTGVVSFDSFMVAYEENQSPYLVLQGHPGKWDNQSFAAFDKVIHFLKASNHRFMLPYQYYKSINP